MPLPPPDPRLSRRAARSGGQPISYLMHQALARPELISLAAGFVDQATLPLEATRLAVEAVLSQGMSGRAALQYGTTPGYPPLREQLLERLCLVDALHTRPTLEQVVVTAGSNQLLHLVADTLLDPGDIVLTASPAYFVFLGAVASVGARGVGVATDQEGIVPDALDEELARRERGGELPRVKAVYVTSYFDNPTSVTLSAARRGRLVEMVRRWSAKSRLYLIEDTAYRLLRYEGSDLPSLRSYDPTGQTVILTGSFSKSFSPGMRVGWGVLPPELIGPVCEQKGNIDFGSPNFNQHVMAAVLERGLFEPHVAELRQRYRLKRDAMLAACQRHLAPLAGVRWRVPAGGLYVWLELPEALDAGPAGRLLELALQAGVLYVPGEYCYPGEGAKVGKNTIRLSFGVQEAEGIAAGIERLAAAIAQAR